MDLLSIANLRSIALGLVVLVLGTSLATPVRSVVRERREMGRLSAQLDAEQQRISELQARTERLKDDAYLQTLIRSRLSYVYPGEIGFVVLDKETATQVAEVPGALVPNSDEAWYSKLWTSTKLADQPVKADDPLVANSR